MSGRTEPSRRQEKVARVIRESVSDTIANHLNDPRIKGIVSITEVDISPDLRNAQVSLSIMAPDEKAQRRTFDAICHATRHIQSRLGSALTSKYCPHLHFIQDEKLKKTLETLNLIDAVSKELHEKDQQQCQDEQIE